MNAREAAYTDSSSLSWLPGAVLQRKCGCGQHTGGGSCSDCEKKKVAGLQTKLTIGDAGDVYEREADQVADQVMSSAGHGRVKPAALQRSSVIWSARVREACQTQVIVPLELNLR